MNITIFPTGKGGAKSAVDYLLSDKDHDGKTRSVQPQILLGDPHTFTEIANATQRLHKYTSGAIAFRDNEHPSEEQVTAVIEAFRSTFLPGLTVDENYADFWVAHRDKGNLELHFLYANTELKTGSQLNIHPPGKKNIEFFNTFVSMTNHALGYAQVVPDPLKVALKPFEAKSPKGKKDKKAKNELAHTLKSHILKGTIANREDLIGFIQENIGEVTRVGHDYISVVFPGAAKAKRLRGELFREGGDYKVLVAQHYASQEPKFFTPEEAKIKQEKLASHIAARAQFNQRRYLTKKPGPNRSRATKKLPMPKPGMKERVQEASMKNDIRASLDRQLQALKEEAPTLTPTKKALASSQLQREPTQPESTPPAMGESGIASLEAQIGSLSLQYHSLMLLLAGATGRRATTLKAQIIILDQKLSALNLDLEKKRAQLKDEQKLKIR